MAKYHCLILQWSVCVGFSCDSIRIANIGLCELKRNRANTALYNLTQY